MAKTINAKVLHVVKTTEEWQAETSTISKGLLCIEVTADGKTLAKVGTGEKPYSELAYLSDGAFEISDYYTSDETDAALSYYATIESVESHTNRKDNPHEVTKEQIGLGDVENKNSETIRSEITKENVVSALGYEPPETDTTYENATAENAGLMSAEDKTTLDTIAEDYIKSDDTLVLTCTL